jgi:signal transduction histidine kinase
MPGGYPERGLGIGLSLVRTLTELHGGSVSAHSGGAGLGSEFIVRFEAASCDSCWWQRGPGSLTFS